MKIKTTITFLLFFFPFLSFGQVSGGDPANALFSIYIDTFSTPPYPYGNSIEGSTFQYKHINTFNGVYPCFDGTVVSNAFFRDTTHVLYFDEGTVFNFSYVLDNGDPGYETYFADTTVIVFETTNDIQTYQTYQLDLILSEEGLLSISCPILGEIKLHLKKKENLGIEPETFASEPLISPIANSSNVMVFPSENEQNRIVLLDFTGKIIKQWNASSPFEVDMSVYSGNLFFFWEQNTKQSRKTKYLKL